ncbi:MAG: hypothetical protein CMO80_02270 [Verrucomicrobiales bacterium]|nr:hypothetical protein [Verrucomicrobiales bacterium]|tara:strand:- start:5472 stop:6119 length:648 start_codon:yes stop_codon:yes gene_type:complete
MTDYYETILSLCIGFGLAAACGFRVFVPMLITSVAAKSGHLELTESFQWIASDAALVAFSAATVLEILGYYIPWVDNALDGVTTPCSVIAGTVVMAGFIPEMDPWLKWSLSIISGGAAAGAVQSVTAFTRGVSTATTSGLANPILSTGEAAASTGVSVAAVFIPFVAAVGLLGMIGFVGYRVAFPKRNQATFRSNFQQLLRSGSERTVPDETPVR